MRAALARPFDVNALLYFYLDVHSLIAVGIAEFAEDREDNMGNNATMIFLRRAVASFALLATSMLVYSTDATAQLRVGDKQPGSHDFQRKLRHCPRVCIIRNDDGGDIDDYLMAAKIFKLQHRYVIFDGECASACALFADKVRHRNACVTHWVRFEFHRIRISGWDKSGRAIGRDTESK